MPYQYDYWWIWCLLLVIGFGGCIGSFINVVVYRLTADMPLDDPLWSFCPECKSPIKWYDNIPVISYFLLNARCRRCRCRIAPRYIIVEVMTIIVFLILFDAFFVGHVVNGIQGKPWSVAYRFYEDWPIYTAHVVLFSCLLAMSAIDMEKYWVDIRFTTFAAFCGFLFHAVWSPARYPPWPTAGPTVSAGAMLATVGCVIVYLVSSWCWKRRTQQENTDTNSCSPEAVPQSSEQPVSNLADTDGPAWKAPPKTFPPSAWLAGLVLYIMLVSLVLALLHEAQIGDRSGGAFAIRILPGLLFIFIAIVAGSIIPRESDQAIEETIEAERHGARKTALNELAIVLFPIALFVVGVLLVRSNGPLHEVWLKCWHWNFGRNTHLLLGVGTAATGFFISCAIGWAVRIVFTLVFGKEAFGTGDIHIMAAAGAVAGWQVVAVGFFLSSLLALLGVVLTSPFKRGRMLPMGPWLTLAIFIVVLLRDPAILYFVKPLEDFFDLFYMKLTGNL